MKEHLIVFATTSKQIGGRHLFPAWLVAICFALGLANLGRAGDITFGTPANISGTNDVSTNGSPVFAVQFDNNSTGPTTVRGVTFVKAIYPGGYSGPYGLYGPYQTNVFYTGPFMVLLEYDGLTPFVAPNFGDTSYNQILNKSSRVNAGASQTILLTNLTVGSTYEIRLFSYAGTTTNSLKLTSGTNTVTLSDGQHVTGTFTAASNSQSFAWSGAVSTNYAVINAVQLRDISSPDITFSAAVNISGPADVSTNGSPVLAANFDNGTSTTNGAIVNGVKFFRVTYTTGGPPYPLYAGSLFTLETAGGAYSTTAPSYGDTGYNAILSRRSHVGKGYNHPITLTNLVPGNKYEIRVFSYYGTSDNALQLSSGSNSVILADKQYVTGTFTAKSDKLTFSWGVASGSALYGMINAIQVRDITPADVTFSAPVNISGPTDVSTRGYSILAAQLDQNATASTVNGVAFTVSTYPGGGPPYPITSGILSLLESGGGTYGAAPNFGDANYNTMLSRRSYVNAGYCYPVTLSNLVAQKTYEIRVFSYYGSSQNSLQLASGSNYVALSDGQYVTGTFTAKTNKLNLTWAVPSGGALYGMINAIQVRDISPATVTFSAPVNISGPADVLTNGSPFISAQYDNTATGPTTVNGATFSVATYPGNAGPPYYLISPNIALGENNGGPYSTAPSFGDANFNQLLSKNSFVSPGNIYPVTLTNLAVGDAYQIRVFSYYGNSSINSLQLSSGSNYITLADAQYVTGTFTANTNTMTLYWGGASGSGKYGIINAIQVRDTSLNSSVAISLGTLVRNQSALVTVTVTNNGTAAVAGVTLDASAIGYGSPVTLTQASLSGNVSVWTNTVTVGVTTPAGSKSLVATATNANGATSLSSASVTVNQVTPTATLALANPTSVTYNASPQAATVVTNSSSVPGTVNNVKYDGSATMPTASGTYAVTADFVPNDPYYTTLTGLNAGSFVIIPAASTVTLSGSSFTYNGLAQTPNISFSGSTGTRSTNYIGASYSGANAPTNAGSYTLMVFVLSDANYYGATNSQNFAISQATTSVGAVSTNNPCGYKDAVAFLATLPGDATGSVVFSSTNGAFSTNSLTSGSATSLSITNLPRGTNGITVAYLGDGNYLGSSTNLEQIVTNHPPVLAPLNLTRTAGLGLHFPWSQLTNQWSDADGDAVNLTAFNLSTTNSVSLITNATLVGYPSTAPNVADQINYIASDSYGDTVAGVINIAVNAYVTGTNSIVNITTGNPTTLKAYGVIGFSYITERSTNLTDWASIATNTVSTNGVISVSDSFSDLGGNPPTSAYYRIKWQP